MDINGITASAGDARTTNASATEGLGSQDFLKLLITQLTNQDPLEPMDNNEMLRQISSIREIELSTTLTDTLRSLTGQQRFASASTLIGQYVTGTPGSDGIARQGIVVGVRFNDAGSALLQLSDGSEVPLDGISTIRSPEQAAQAMVGLGVIGVDRRDPGKPKPVEGIATSARSDDTGAMILELDTGESLRLRDVFGISQAQAA